MAHPYAKAKSLYVYGQHYAASGQIDLARERYDAALAILRQLGEELYAAHVERALTQVSAR